jgi:plastocyanin
MAAGRLFDVCPCTRRKADEQYWRASFHALTPTEQALVRNSRPRSVQGWLAYGIAPFAVTAEWIGKGVGWLGGDRPLHAAYISIGLAEFAPAEVHVAPGATVIWRNQDDDVHVVTADNGQFASPPLNPGEAFAHTFNQRGRTGFYDASYGDFGRTDVVGTVIVD